MTKPFSLKSKHDKILKVFKLPEFTYPLSSIFTYPVNHDFMVLLNFKFLNSSVTGCAEKFLLKVTQACQYNFADCFHSMVLCSLKHTCTSYCNCSVIDSCAGNQYNL